MKVYGFTTVAPVAGRMAGAVVFYHQIAKRFVELGHEVIVQVRSRRGSFSDITVDGVQYKKTVYPVGADLFLFHSASLELNPNFNQIKVPILYVLHSSAASIWEDINSLTMKDYLISNSKNMMESVKKVRTNHQLLYPIVDKKYLEPREGVHNSYTCIGSSTVKNLGLFYNLAQRSPKTPFIHVLGGYGNDIKKIRPYNMSIVKNSTDLREVYARTRVLVAPSFSETYSLVAREAGLQGIPVVCSTLPGFRENLGEAGLYANPHHIESFEKQISKLKDPVFYKNQSEFIREHCLEEEKKNSARLDKLIGSLEANSSIQLVS